MEEHNSIDSAPAQTIEMGIAGPRKPKITVNGVSGIRKRMAFAVNGFSEGSVAGNRSSV